MATHNNNSKQMSTQDIKEVLINTFKRSAEKSVQDASYDKTILATIQFCTDSSIGQYKIKYQNGYYTAYARDTSMMYTNNALVYVLVPGNDMNNRLFITGAATNDSSQRVYLTNLEGDQQYSIEGSNYITGVNGSEDSLDLSSYWGTNTIYTKTLWNVNSVNNILKLNPQINEYLSSAKVIRFSASFKTTLTEDRKLSGDYGLVLTLKYHNEKGDYFKNFTLDTFHMIGSPFNFNVFMPQYNYFEVNQSEFVGVEQIDAYVVGFPVGTAPSFDYRDIFIRDIGLYKAVKLYDTTDDKYRVEIQSDDDFDFYNGTSGGVDQYKTSISCRATLKVNGNPVSSSNGQNIKYYWAKEDVSVNSVNHPKYNNYTGKGWYCLNTGSKVKYDGQVSEQELRDYTITQTDTTTPSELILWDSNMPQINLLRKLCKGKFTNIKCVVCYENQIISSEIKTVLNKEGYYIVIKSQDDKTVAYNGKGNFTLTAGIFKDGGSAPDTSKTLDSANVTYSWMEVNEKGIEKNIPVNWRQAEQDINDLLLSNPEWDEEDDNETKTDIEVEEYLDGRDSLALCKERYEYYNNKYNELNIQEHPNETQLNRCYTRKTNIVSTKFNQVLAMYNNGDSNSFYYILGPSAVEGEYTNPDIPDYRTARIIQTTCVSSPIVYNTLYNLPAIKIGNRATYKVSAMLTELDEGVPITQPIGTTEITLINQEGASLDYTLNITNGTQTFLYDEGGIAPNNLISPLFFTLYDNKAGDLVFDSARPDQYPELSLALLNPVWSFYDSSHSLIQTKYEGSPDTTKVNGMLQVRESASLVYLLNKNFDINKRDNSNISLQIKYKDSAVFAETHFTFLKQGDLGTNGTNMTLDIDDNNYEAYQSNVLADPRWSTFTTQEGGIEVKKYYQPAQRHLNNTYLFATMAYNAEGVQQEQTDTCNFVNLQFAQGPIEINDEPIGVNGSRQATLFGYWYQDNVMQPINNDSKWSSEIISGHYNGLNYYLKPSFDILTSVGPQTTLSIAYINNDRNVDIAYKPTVINNIPVEGVVYDKRIANNIVRVESKNIINGRQVSNYGYYPIPYYYYNYTGNNPMPAGFDPAKHIVIVGGFDSVVYDNAGENPVFNKQEPFKFYMFDENQNDITVDVLKGVASNRTTITWNCSNGLKQYQQLSSTNAIPNFEDISNDVNLYNSYCRYSNKIYKCIVSHTKGQTVEIKNADGTVRKTYNPGEFVTPYWEEVNLLQESLQQYSVIPLQKYDMVAQSDLFNSWISLNISYVALNNTKYNAEVMIPINMICNKYGSTEINNWDGKKCQIHENEGYLIGSKVAAGIKNNDNSFTGIALGTNFYPDDAERKEEVGLFGFGIVDTGKTQNPQTWARTMFLNARSGRAIFGPTGGTQIVLDPGIPTGNNRIWSRLAGWYFDKDFLYKPIGEGNILNFNALAQDENSITPPNTGLGSAGLYVPWDTKSNPITAKTRFIWASNNDITYSNFQTSTPNFYVTYGGQLYCNDAYITGSVVATDGSFGTGVNKIHINYTDTKSQNHYILYNRNFWIRDTNGEGASDNAVFVKGKIMAKSGQFGQVGDDKDGNSSGTVFIEYNWYPWHLPADNEPWNNDYMYLDTSEGMSVTYALYHKNFHVTNSGEAFFNGKLFTESGRIGNWVINRSYLRSVNGNVTLAPERLTIGAFSADQYGNLRGQDWYINADGTASFTNNGNQFVGRSFRTANGSSMGEGGLRLGPGDKFFIGEGDGTYMYALNNGFSFNGVVDFADTVTLRSALEFVSGGSSAMTINSSGIRFGNTGRSITSGGNATLGSVAVDSLTIGGTSLADYIRSVAGIAVASNKLGNLNADSIVVTSVTQHS